MLYIRLRWCHPLSMCSLILPYLIFTNSDSAFYFLLSSWSQSHLLLARRPWGQLAEVHLFKPFTLPLPLPQFVCQHLRGGCAGRRGSREAQVQQSLSHLRAAAAAGARSGAVCQRDVQRVRFYGENKRGWARTEHRGTFQQVPDLSTFVTATVLRITVWFSLGMVITGDMTGE